MKMSVNILILLLLNFGTLAIGGLFTGDGVASDWYSELDKAPWTPPGWVFGAAWTTIMICFTFYMGILLRRAKTKQKVRSLYILQLVLNITWNPIFFYYQFPSIALVVIITLTLLIFYFLLNYRKTLGWYSILIVPYVVWLCIATSLNLYILLSN
ncbi:MAG: tryptophan-rich sensory protein [Crocinitomicaceae bacterium]|nr:tryptophan-rich sensory protein [Crocinitomicaceae bacterium]